MTEIPTAYLEDLKRRGILDDMYQLGLVGHKAYMMLEIRHKVNDLMAQGLSRGQAVNKTADSVGLHRVTIYKYL